MTGSYKSVSEKIRSEEEKEEENMMMNESD